MPFIFKVPGTIPNVSVPGYLFFCKKDKLAEGRALFLIYFIRGLYGKRYLVQTEDYVRYRAYIFRTETMASFLRVGGTRLMPHKTQQFSTNPPRAASHPLPKFATRTRIVKTDGCCAAVTSSPSPLKRVPAHPVSDPRWASSLLPSDCDNWHGSAGESRRHYCPHG